MILTSRFASFLVIALVGTSLAHAQNNSYSQTAPKPVSMHVKGPIEGNASPVSGNEVILDNLQGIVFLGDSKDVKVNGVRLSGVSFLDVSIPNEAKLKSQVSVYLGKTFTRADLNKITQDVVVQYQAAGLPVVTVVTPRQDITDGTIQLLVLQAHLGAITASGNKWTSSSDILAEIHAKPGEPIREGQIQDDLDWLNANPFHNTEAVYSPGSSTGLTDIDFHTTDRFPVRAYTGYEDNGVADSGIDRYFAGAEWGNAFGLNQQLAYQFTTGGDSNQFRAHSVDYVVPLPWRNTLSFFGNYTDAKSSVSVPPLVKITGRSYQISGRYTVPMPTLHAYDLGLSYSQAIGAGFDYKYNNNALQYGGTNTPLTLYDIDQFVITYDSKEKDPFGETTFNDVLNVSPGNFGGNNNDAAFEATHPGSTSSYVYNTLVMERLTRLPWDFTLSLKGTVQTSNDNLPTSEQLAFGGFDSIRGYDTREVTSDDGYIFNVELRTPPVSIGKFFHAEKYNDELQFLTFWDSGSAYSHRLQPGEPTEIGFSSTGIGVRYNINDYLSFHFDFGMELVNTGLNADDGSKSNLGIVLSY